MDLPFFLSITDIQLVKDAFGEYRISVGIYDIAFQTTDHDLVDLCRIRFLQRTGKSLVVEQFQEGIERIGIAIVRRGRQK